MDPFLVGRQRESSERAVFKQLAVTLNTHPVHSIRAHFTAPIFDLSTWNLLWGKIDKFQRQFSNL